MSLKSIFNLGCCDGVLGLFVVASPIVKEQQKFGEEIKERISGMFKDVQNLEIFDLIISLESAEKVARKVKDKISGCVIVVATGGTERVIRAISNKIRKPTLLYAHQFQNSLASSLEVFSKLKDEIPMKVLYAPLYSKVLVKEVKSFVEVCEAIDKLENCRLGVVGEPSKWILTSENKQIIEKFGPKIIQLKIADLIDLMKKVGIEEAKNISKKLKKNFKQIEVSESDMINSANVYLAMKELISKYNLSAITIRCFDLLNYNCTACLGMSLCNDEGLVAGCEADLQATLTMMVVSFLTSQPCWMANSSRIDKYKNTITLAHCTIATKMITDLSEATLLPHMESGKCLSIRGPLKRGEVTLARLGGNNLDKMLIATGKVVKNLQEPDLCRTQVEVKLNGNVEGLLTNTLGNHHILTYGNLESKLLDFCKFKGIQPIVIK